MKKTFHFLCALLLATFVRATPVIFPLQVMTGSHVNRQITLTPDQPTNALVNLTNLVGVLPIPVHPTNGVGAADLLSWSYTVRVDGWPNTFHILVPDTTNTLSVVDLVTNAVAVGLSVAQALTTNSLSSDFTNNAGTIGIAPEIKSSIASAVTTNDNRALTLTNPGNAFAGTLTGTLAGNALSQSTNIAAAQAQAATNNPDLARYSGGAISNGQASVQFGGTAISMLNYFGNGVIQATNPVSGKSSTMSGDGFSGDGSSLTGLDAGQLTTGTIPDARLSSTVMHTNGSSNLITGNGSDSGLSPSSVITLNATNAQLTNPIVALNSTWKALKVGTMRESPKGINGWWGSWVNNETNYATYMTNMVNNGMLRNGWVYMQSDDGIFPYITNSTPYSGLTNAQGVMDLNPSTFPSGGQALCDKIHSMGLRFGMYVQNATNGNGAVPGQPTVYWAQPGAYGTSCWQRSMTNYISNWGVDYVKNEQICNIFYEGVLLRSIINETCRTNGHTVWVCGSIGNWPDGNYGYHNWYPDVMNAWRTGVSPYGDVQSMVIFDQWLDKTPFDVNAPWRVNDLDQMYRSATYGLEFAALLMRREFAIDSMSGASMLLGTGHLEQYEDYNPLQGANYGGGEAFYEDWTIPTVNQIHADLSHIDIIRVGMTNGILAYKRQDKDGYWWWAFMSRTNSTQIYTVTAQDVCPNAPNGIFTPHDCFLNSATSWTTNTYDVSVTASNTMWYKFVPGIENPFNVGTNSLTYQPWIYHYRPYNGAAEAINLLPGPNFNWFGSKMQRQTNAAGQFVGFTFNNNSDYGTNATAFMFYATKTNTTTWQINGQATKFTALIGAPYLDTWVQILTNGVEAYSSTIALNTASNVLVNMVGVNTLTLNATNNSAAFYVGDPNVYCPTKTSWDATGKKTVQIDPAAISIVTP